MEDLLASFPNSLIIKNTRYTDLAMLVDSSGVLYGSPAYVVEFKNSPNPQLLKEHCLFRNYELNSNGERIFDIDVYHKHKKVSRKLLL